MRYFKILALSLLCALSAQAQLTIPLPAEIVTDSKLAAAVRKLNQRIDSLAQIGKPVTPPPVVDPPVVIKPRCPEGPEPRQVYDVTSNSAQLLWHGKEVSSFDFAIYKSGKRVFLGNVVPTQNRERIEFNPALAAGEYEIVLTGSACSSSPSDPIKFVVPGESGGVSPPPVVKPPVENAGALQVSGFYSPENSRAEFKVSIAKGTPPYSIQCIDFLGRTMHSASVSGSKAEIPNNAFAAGGGGIQIKVTDSQGRKGETAYDNGTLYGLKRVFIGFSIADGDANNHVERIKKGDELGFSGTGAIFETNTIVTDADLENLANTKFDPNQPLSSRAFRYDKTIKALVEANNATLLRINIDLKREAEQLNNGSTRKNFVSIEDAQMRVDGVTPIMRFTGFRDKVVPSYASKQALKSAQLIYTAYVKHYIDQINSGRIIAIGLISSNNGEGEILPGYLKGENEQDTDLWSSNTHGDFNPESVSLFKRTYPQYANKSNYEIATAAYNSDLAVKWTHHNNQLIINFERAVIEYVYAHVPELLRTRIYQIDSGSFVDGLAPYRRTYNITERALNPHVMMIKSNDGSDVSADVMDFYLDQISTAAALSGGVAVIEPSPRNYEDPENSWGIIAEINKAWYRGIGTSFYTPRADIAKNLLDRSVAKPNALPLGKSQYKDDRLQEHQIDLSEVYKKGGFSGEEGWLRSWKRFRDDTGVEHVHTVTVDDVSPR